jgi:transposase-like protein
VKNSWAGRETVNNQLMVVYRAVQSRNGQLQFISLYSPRSSLASSEFMFELVLFDGKKSSKKKLLLAGDY